MALHIFRARTFYIASGLWLLGLLLILSIGSDRWFPAGSPPSAVLLVVLSVSLWAPIVFAIWQGVHWAFGRSARKIERQLGVDERHPPRHVGEELPAALAALSAADVQKVVDYRTMKAALGRASMSSFALGGVALFMLVGASTWLGRGVLLLLAALLLHQGVWLRRSTNSLAVIAGGLTIVVLGLWTLSGGLDNEQGKNASSSPWVTIGIAQLGLGVATLRRFSAVRRLGRVEPDPQVLGALETVLFDVAGEHRKSAGGVVFTTTHVFRSINLIGHLTPRLSLFVSEPGDDVLVGDPSETDITPREENTTHQPIKASLRIGEHVFRGTISPQSFARYQRWKSSVAA